MKLHAELKAGGQPPLLGNNKERIISDCDSESPKRKQQNHKKNKWEALVYV